MTLTWKKQYFFLLNLLYSVSEPVEGWKDPIVHISTMQNIKRNTLYLRFSFVSDVDKIKNETSKFCMLASLCTFIVHCKPIVYIIPAGFLGILTAVIADMDERKKVCLSLKRQTRHFKLL